MVLLTVTISVLPAHAGLAEDILAQHERWERDELLRIGDYYEYMVCQKAKTCFELGITYVGAENDGHKFDVIIREKLGYFVYDENHYRQVGSVNANITSDIFDMVYIQNAGEVDADWKIFQVISDGMWRITNSPKYYSDQNLRYIEETLFFLGGKVKIGDGDILEYAPILETGKVWSISDTHQISVAGITYNYAFLDSKINEKLYEIQYKSDSTTAEFIISPDSPFPISATVPTLVHTGKSIYDDPNIISPFWFRLTNSNTELVDSLKEPHSNLYSEISQNANDTILTIHDNSRQHTGNDYLSNSDVDFTVDSSINSRVDSDVSADVSTGVKIDTSGVTPDDITEDITNDTTNDISGDTLDDHTWNMSDKIYDIISSLLELVDSDTLISILRGDATNDTNSSVEDESENLAKNNQKTLNVTITTDMKKYLLGQTITFSGHITRYDDALEIRLYNSNGQLFEHIPIDAKSGLYTAEYVTKSNIGTITAIITYENYDVSAEFEVIMSSDEIILDGRVHSIILSYDHLEIFVEQGMQTDAILFIPKNVFDSTLYDQDEPFIIYVDGIRMWSAVEQIGIHGRSISLDLPTHSHILEVYSAGNTALCSGTARCISGVLQGVYDDIIITLSDDTLVYPALVFAGYSGIEYDVEYDVEYQNNVDLILDVCPAGSRVIVDEDDFQTGNFKEIIAKIYCNGIILNEYLLQNVDIRYPHNTPCSVSEFSSERWAKHC